MSTLTVVDNCEARPLAVAADGGMASLNQLAVHEVSVQSRRPVRVDVGHTFTTHLSVVIHLSIHAASVLEAPQHTNTTHFNWAAADFPSGWREVFQTQTWKQLNLGKTQVWTHRVVDPTFPTAAVVLVMTFEYQVTFAIKLLSGSVQFSVHIRSVKNPAIFILIFSPTLETVIHIETLQGAGGEGQCSVKSSSLLAVINDKSSLDY